MSQPFLGQVMPVAFDFAPRGFAFCSGQLLPISQNQALFSLLGTSYGGDGRTTFALPDLRGRTPVGARYNTDIGQAGGVENVTLTTAQIPAHSHMFNVSTATGTTRIPGSGVLGAASSIDIYASPNAGLTPLNVLDQAGQSQPHANLQPYAVLNFCIALNGIFPTRS